MFSRRTVALVALVAGALALGTGIGYRMASAQQPHDISGTWRVTGWDVGADPGSDPGYQGTVDVQPLGDCVYDITWHFPSVVHGVAIYHEESRALAVASIQDEEINIGLYLEDEGRLDGAYSLPSANGGVGFETWER